MEQKYLLLLMGFEVSLIDRRNGELEGGFIVVPFPEEYPEDLEDAYNEIRKYYGNLGYDVKEIKHQASKVKELDLKAEYDKAPTMEQYTTQKGETEA